MDEFRKRDPVLRLLPPEVPDSFAALAPDEQTIRGRYWLIMYGAGYEPAHAWWVVLRDDPEMVASMKATVEQTDEGAIPLMVQGRLAYERGKALVPEGTVQ